MNDKINITQLIDGLLSSSLFSMMFTPLNKISIAQHILGAIK